ncbi:hypothetical protein FALBO_161 [Fusarium albosuccineum]|uniref:NmrA-like domain-containing protein n=1 Tax=Fusarium albosuccineum TaxID=1237068 RepID=A0A8H4LQ56_9HYPO|nr:hypothetical protein FALBO_161 [Fusarium albosuccineum]
MSVVAVAGGSGDLGAIIVEALFETEKYDVRVLSRKAPAMPFMRISPTTGEAYLPFVEANYSSEAALIETLSKYKVEVIICAFGLRNDAACDAQLQLIRAADKAPSVKRFIPSEFNIDYSLGDAVPYPNKRFHLAARRELEKTSLEFSHIYAGMFMDYYVIPKFTTTIRPLCFFVDPVNNAAVLADDGEAKMSMTLTEDIARYTVLALELDKWPKVMTTAPSTISLNELVALFEKHTGHKFQVQYQPVSKLLEHDSIPLPENSAIYERSPERFPNGPQQLQSVIADLEASVALESYDFDRLEGHLDLVKAFEGKTSPPRRIEDLVKKRWGAK